MTNTIETGLGRIHLRAEFIFGFMPNSGDGLNLKERRGDIYLSHLISGDCLYRVVLALSFSLILFQATTVLLWESFGELIWFYLVRPLHIKGKT